MLSASVLIRLCSLRAFTYEQFGDELRDFVADFADINFKLFSKESLLVVGMVAPLYVGAQLIDAQVHELLYDPVCHADRFSSSCLRHCFAEDLGITLPLLALSGGLWCSSDYRTRLVGRDLLAGMVGIGLAKTAIKNCAYGNFCYRPYGGCFPKKRIFGGFPSGHAATLAYATIFLGLQKGACWAIPVGVYGATVITSVLVCNYHYVSQVVAGSALGALYAVAADKLVDERVHALELGVVSDSRGSPRFQLAYSF